MADTNWTPGPWLASEVDWFGDHNIQSKEGVETDTDHLAIAAVVSNLRPAEEVAANAHLIAAAPTLYEALAEAVDHYGKPGGPWNVPNDPGGWLEKARAALAQAHFRKERNDG